MKEGCLSAGGGGFENSPIPVAPEVFVCTRCLCFFKNGELIPAPLHFCSGTVLMVFKAFAGSPYPMLVESPSRAVCSDVSGGCCFRRLFGFLEMAEPS